MQRAELKENHVIVGHGTMLVARHLLHHIFQSCMSTAAVAEMASSGDVDMPFLKEC